MLYMPDYKLDPPEPSNFQQWLDTLTPDDVVEICADTVIKQMWNEEDSRVRDCLYKHYRDLKDYARE